MLPNIVLGHKTITPYSICVAIGIILAGLVAIFSLRRKVKDREPDLIIVLLIATAGSIVGGSLLYGITNIPNMIKLISHGYIIEGLSYGFGGSVFYGGLFGGLLSGLFGCKLMKVPFHLISDIVAFVIPLFHAFGRLGCFLSGCCYGIESDIGFIFRHSLITSANGVRRFPVQLVESAGDFIIFLVIFALWHTQVMKKPHSKLQNRLLGLYFMIYPVMRFMLEFLRGDTYRGFVGVLSTSQFISIFAFILGVFLVTRKIKNNIKGETA